MSSTYSMTMANVKPEDPDSSVWHGYSIQTPSSSASQHNMYDSSYQTASLAIPYHGRTQKDAYRSLDLPALQTRPSPREESVSLATSPPHLNTHHSYPSLKRTFQGESEIAYMDNVQYFRDEPTDIAKPTISQDHRLLNFGKSPDKHTILDSQGRVKQIDVTAQLHGMFFLSELATPSGESLLAQPELTCYRRNLFQISGNVSIPRGPLSLVSERGERVAIVSQELSISATESVDGHVVKLIVIPWKTPPPNSPEIPLGQEHEPVPIPLIDYDEGRDPNNEFALFPIAYRRLQFRIATANNGRRRELQQHFTLHLQVVGTLANGTRTNLCDSSTAPIVVRGRSPRNFQARKEIPLVGSSSSRGHPSDLQAGTMSTPQNAVIQRRATIPKPALELRRVPFTFDSTALSGSPSMTRQSNYQSWSASNTPVGPEQASASLTSSSYPSSAISLDSFLQTAPPPSSLLSSPHLHSPSSATNTMTAPPIPSPAQSGRHYGFSANSNSLPTAVSGSAQSAQSPLRFVDSNPRPAKSPRHTVPPELSSSTYDYGARFAPPYQGPGVGGSPVVTRTTEYFPATMSMPAASSWTTSTDTANLYGTAATHLTGNLQLQSSATNQHYEFPGENYGKSDSEGTAGRQLSQQQQQHYAWNQS